MGPFLRKKDGASEGTTNENGWRQHSSYLSNKADYLIEQIEGLGGTALMDFLTNAKLN